MVTIVRPKTRQTHPPGVKYVTRRRGAQILDRQARKYLGMSGAEFVRRYRAGDFDEADDSTIARIAILIPFAEQ